MEMSAELFAPDRVRLPYAPWGAFDAAKDDVLRIERDHDGQWWVAEKTTASGYCAIRITTVDENDLEDFEAAALTDFRPHRGSTSATPAKTA